MLVKKVNLGNKKEIELINLELKDKNVSLEYEESKELMYFIDKNKYNYYKLEFDRTLNLKNFLNNIKNLIIGTKNKVVDFIRNCFSESFQYPNVPDRIIIDLDKEDILQFQEKLSEEIARLEEEKKKELSNS